jgi:hypothetical protein
MSATRSMHSYETYVPTTTPNSTTSDGCKPFPSHHESKAFQGVTKGHGASKVPPCATDQALCRGDQSLTLGTRHLAEPLLAMHPLRRGSSMPQGPFSADPVHVTAEPWAAPLGTSMPQAEGGVPAAAPAAAASVEALPGMLGLPASPRDAVLMAVEASYACASKAFVCRPPLCAPQVEKVATFRSLARQSFPNMFPAPDRIVLQSDKLPKYIVLFQASTQLRYLQYPMAANRSFARASKCDCLEPAAFLLQCSGC